MTELTPLPVHPAPLPAPPPSGPEVQPESGAGAPWRRYLLALWGARWLLLAALVVGSAAGVFGIRFVPLTYRAQSTLWVEVPTTRAGQGPIRSEELLQSYGWIELLTSFTVLDHAVRELRLFVHAESPRDARALRSLSLAERYRPGSYRLTVDSTRSRYVLATADGAEVERGTVGGPIGERVGLVWSPPAALLPAGEAVEFTIENVRDRAASLGERLEPQMIENSSFLRLSLVGNDPDETAATLRSITQRYVEVAAQLKRAKLDELTGVLSEQLRYAEENLRVAESDLESFRVNTITLPSEQASPVAPGLEVTRDPVIAAYFDLKIDREEFRADRESLDRVLRQVTDSALSVDALAAIPAVQRSLSLTQALQESAQKRTELRGLLGRYTSDHERVRRLREEIAQLDGVAIPRLVAQVRDQLSTQEAIYDGRIGSASRELEQIPPRVIEEARLQRRVQIANNLHGTLQQRYEEARLATASSIPDIRILDAAAAPSAPLSDRRPLVLLATVLGALGLVVAGVIGKEVTDSRVRYPEQIIHGIGLPVLGTIPHVTGSAEGDDVTHAMEGFREIRLGLVHAHGLPSPLALTIVSPESGDGKSFVAANLAAAFAQRGDRTLLIDADVRRGKLHHLLRGARAPGLTDFLSGEISVEQLLQPTARPSLWFAGSGTRMRNGPELLGSPRFAALLASMQQQFDVVLIDSPPLGAGADPYVLATVTRNLLVVLRTGITDLAFAEAKLRVMARLPVRILGAVLNDFTPGPLYRYYSYLPGYAAESEAEGGTALALVEPAARGR